MIFHINQVLLQNLQIVLLPAGARFVVVVVILACQKADRLTLVATTARDYCQYYYPLSS